MKKFLALIFVFAFISAPLQAFARSTDEFVVKCGTLTKDEKVFWLNTGDQSYHLFNRAHWDVPFGHLGKEVCMEGFLARNKQNQVFGLSFTKVIRQDGTYVAPLITEKEEQWVKKTGIIQKVPNSPTKLYLKVGRRQYRLFNRKDWREAFRHVGCEATVEGFLNKDKMGFPYGISYTRITSTGTCTSTKSPSSSVSLSPIAPTYTPPVITPEPVYTPPPTLPVEEEIEDVIEELDEITEEEEDLGDLEEELEDILRELFQ